MQGSTHREQAVEKFAVLDSDIDALSLNPRNDDSMTYSETITFKLRPEHGNGPLVVDLFAGCGGLALGFEAQGFQTLGYEMDDDCCASYRTNLRGTCKQELLSPDTALPSAPVLIGGPPCQPFSVNGHQKGLKDSRDGFPTFIAAVAKLQPEIWMFENVRGMLYGNRRYFEEIIAALGDLGYIVEYELLNAVDFGVPQNRERIIVVGHRGEFSFPMKIQPRVTAGEALGTLMSGVPEGSRFLTASMDSYVARYEKASACIRPRDLHPELPARTLTCRNLAGATGDMHRIRLPDGRRRRLVAREAARLQSFPDWFEFVGSEGSVFKQIGNAVAPLFAFHLAASVRDYLLSHQRMDSETIRRQRLPRQAELIAVEL